MKRTLYLNALPKTPIPSKAIAPTQAAARALGVPHQNLEILAQKTLSVNHLRVAPVLSAQRALHSAVKEIAPTDDISGKARSLAPTVQSLFRAGIDLDALAAVANPRIQQLAAIARRYQTHLRSRHFVDPAELFWQAAKHARDRLSLFIYGYFHPRADELAFIEAIAGDGSSFFLPCPDSPLFADNRNSALSLQTQGWQVEIPDNASPSSFPLSQCFLDATSPPKSIRAHSYPHQEAEVRGVLTQVKSLLQRGIPANEIALIARDDAFYGSLLLDLAWECDVPVRALYAVPLNVTRLGAWVQLLLEIIQENLPFESTAKLLSHPLSLGLSPEIWPQARLQHPSGYQAWQKLGVNLSILNWPLRDTRENWVQRLQNAFNFFNIRQRSGRWAREIVAYYKLEEGLVDLSQPESQSLSLEEFARDVIDTLALLSVPAQPGRGGVELLMPVSTFGARYQYVFILGAVEGIFPAPVQDDAILDFHDRAALIQLGFPLESATSCAYREAIAAYCLFQTPTTSLTFSYPQLIGNASTLPSPYLTRLQLQPTPPPPQSCASVEELRRIYLRRDRRIDALLPTIYKAWFVEKRRESSQACDEYDGAIGIPLDPASRTFSASQLTALGQCPFKWFAAYLLKLADLEEAALDLDAPSKGRLYHHTLELALCQLETTANRQQAIAQLESAFRQAEIDLNLPEWKAWDARRNEHLITLQRAIEQPDFWQEGAEIRAVEQKFEGEWHGLKIAGRIDRIDSTSQGLILIDYKTSSSSPIGIKDEFGKANLDIQMPLYTHIAQTRLYPGEAVANSYYYSITKGKKLSKSPPDEATLQAIAQRLKSHLEMGNYPVKPDSDRKACTYCSCDLVCRKGARNSRKVEE